VRDAEPRDDLVEDEYRVVDARDLAEPFEETRARRDHAHVAGDRLDDDGGDLAPALVEERPDGVEVVERGRERHLGERRRYAAAVRARQGRAAGARFHEQAVRVAVVAAVELHEERAAGRATG